MQEIKQQLLALAEPGYREFSQSLLPGVDYILGVRLPALRKIAVQLAKEDWCGYLAETPRETFEERMLQGMVIGCVKVELGEKLRLAANFVPQIDNWSLCDSFCNGLKIAKTHPGEVWEFLQPYFTSEREFCVRFGVVMLLDYYSNPEYIGKILPLLESVSHDGYYAKMAVAWAVSICYIKCPEATLRFLQDNTLDDFTYNKALQKITESLRIAPPIKAVIRLMRRKTFKIEQKGEK